MKKIQKNTNLMGVTMKFDKSCFGKTPILAKNFSGISQKRHIL